MSRPPSTHPGPKTLGYEPEPDKEPEQVHRMEKALPIKIMAALSMPRLCFTDAMMCSMILPTLGIEVQKASGAFWEQSMTNLMLTAIERNFDFVLTVDYDSVFKPMDVYYLARLMYENPEVDAVFPLQYRRGVKQLLLAVEDGEAEQPVAHFVANPLMPARVGHFGLTLIRCSTLKFLPQPWLWSQPNKDGLWGPGKKDADIYFWDKMRECKRKVCCATRCVIGHMEEMITWPGENLAPTHEYVSQYFADGDLPTVIQQAAMKRLEEAKKAAEETQAQGSAVNA